MLMKLIYFPALLFAALLIFISCEYEDYEYQNSEQTLARINTESTFWDNELGMYNIFEYDEYGRLIRNSYVEGMGGSYTTEITTITKDQIITHEYYEQIDTPFVYVDYLNLNGMVDSTIYKYNNKVEMRVDYKYDRAGYLTERVVKSDEYGMYFTMNNKIMNGNITRTIMHSVYGFNEPTLQIKDIQLRKISSRLFKSDIAKQTMLKRFRLPRSKNIGSSYEYIDTLYFEYNKKLNTISDINRGLVWEGLQNRNLVEKEILQYRGTTESRKFVYEFDGKGRVTKQYYVEYQGDYSLFTYKDVKVTN